MYRNNQAPARHAQSNVVPPSEIWDLQPGSTHRTIFTLQSQGVSGHGSAPVRGSWRRAASRQRVRPPAWWDFREWNSYVFGLVVGSVLLITGLAVLDDSGSQYLPVSPDYATVQQAGVQDTHAK